MRFCSRTLLHLRLRDSWRRVFCFVLPRLEYLEDRLVPSGDFVQTNLVSDIAGFASTTDANLINPWDSSNV